jgi:hypothetical protein
LRGRFSLERLVPSVPAPLLLNPRCVPIAYLSHTYRIPIAYLSHTYRIPIAYTAHTYRVPEVDRINLGYTPCMR